MNINLKKKSIKITLIALTFVILFFSSIVYCTNRISKEMERQLESNLTDVANQNALAIRNQLNNNYLLLQSLITELKEMPGDMRDDVMLLKGFAKSHNLKRIGYFTPDGTTYNTDEVDANLSYREFFKRGM